jgi:protein SCO1/2
MQRFYFSLALLTAFGACGCNSRHDDAVLADLGPVAEFSLTERSGRTVTRADLEGKVWVAAFIFTRCAGPCSQVSGSMARLQHDLAQEAGVQLVSFTVDPDYDSPKVLTDYAERFAADPERWIFLTGPKDDIYALIVKSFHLGVEEASGAARKPGLEVTHSTKLVLVDQLGHIRTPVDRHGQRRGYFDGAPSDGRTDDLPELERAARELVKNRSAGSSLTSSFRLLPDGLPSLNALLNAISGLLLVAGYVAVRRRYIAVHKTCMLSALAVSAVFLASYLYFHFVVMDGKPTRFSDRAPSAPQWVQWTYLTILLTHTALAAVVAPLAITTATFGLRNRIQRHMRLARWTLPIWLYVSVTGVVVYWMLYRLYPAP